MENFFTNDDIDLKYDKYLKDMRVKINEDNIFYSKYYIVVALKKQENIEEIDKVVSLLKNCGCDVIRLDKKYDILLYCINYNE